MCLHICFPQEVHDHVQGFSPSQEAAGKIAVLLHVLMRDVKGGGDMVQECGQTGRCAQTQMATIKGLGNSGCPQRAAADPVQHPDAYAFRRKRSGLLKA